MTTAGRSEQHDVRHADIRSERGEVLNDGYALGFTLCAVLLVAAVLIALIVLRPHGPTEMGER